MSWGLISKLCLLASIGMVVWMLYPAGKCTAGGVDNEHDGVTEIYDNLYGHLPGEGREEGAPTFKDNMKACFAEFPVTKYPWQPLSAGGLFLGWIVLRWVNAKAYHNQIRKSQDHERVR